MAKKITNRSKIVQCIKRPTPGGNIGGLYAASINLKPGDSVTVPDNEFAAMEIGSGLEVTFIADSIPDSEEEILDITGGGGGSVVDWDNRQLKKSDGSVVVDWQNTSLVTNGIARVDWGGCYLIDFSGDNGSLDWNNRHLLSSNGTSSTIEWDTHILRDDNGILALEWKGRWCSNELGEVAFHWHSSGMAGTTLGRPAGLLAIGYFFFDTDLNKPIWWNGTGWVDATGTGV